VFKLSKTPDEKMGVHTGQTYRMVRWWLERGHTIINMRNNVAAYFPEYTKFVATVRYNYLLLLTNVVELSKHVQTKK